MSNFESRLNLVLAGRKQTPWGKSLGFPSATVSAIFNGRVPGEKFLYTIRQAENINLDWLLTGKGMPFFVGLVNKAESFADLVKIMLEDEPFLQVYVCSLSDRTILLFDQLGTWSHAGGIEIETHHLEILVGPGSEELAEILRGLPNKKQIRIPLLSSESEDAIATGQVGTYLLFDSHDALLANYRPAKESDLQYYSSTSKLTSDSKTKIEDPIQLNLMRTVITLVEDCAAKLGETLNSEQKSRVITAVYRQADRLKQSPDDLTIDSIRTAIDVIRD